MPDAVQFFRMMAGFERSPWVKKIRRHLDCDLVHAAGVFAMAASLIDAQANVDDVLEGWDADMVDDEICPGAAEALLAVGALEQTDDGLSSCIGSSAAARVVKRRETERDRKQVARAKRKAFCDANPGRTLTDEQIRHRMSAKTLDEKKLGKEDYDAFIRIKSEDAVK